MASPRIPMNIELDTLVDQVASQFRNLNPNEPGQWPLLPKLAAWSAMTAVVVLLGWFGVVSSAADELDELLVLGERAAVEREPAPHDVGAQLRLRDRVGSADRQLARRLEAVLVAERHLVGRRRRAAGGARSSPPRRSSR